jgi:CheY-like chemotaxis protein
LSAEKTEEGSLVGEGRILLVDDEEIVRSSAGAVLRRLGYEVAFARDGLEGIELYQAARGEKRPFDAVLMDLTIPGGMGGREAVKGLKKIDPDAKVIVSSGYSSDPIMSRFREYGFDGVVAKPYTIRDLGTTLRKVLSEHEG